MKKLNIIWISILWLRQIIFLFYMFTMTIIFAYLTIVCGYLKMPIYIRILPAKIWSIFMSWGILIILWLKIKIIGKKNITKTPCIYVSKHHSIWETMIFHGLLYKSCFVLKKELLSIPILGKALKFAGNIPINRRYGFKSLKSILHNGKKRLSQDISIIIFPEGTRVKIKQYPKFYKTAFMLSKITKYQIIPIAHNSGLFWPKCNKLIKPGCIKICFGKPIVVTNYSNIEKLNYQCYTWINNKVKSLGA